jgi:hypothetical protein
MKYYATNNAGRLHAGIQFPIALIVAGTAVGVYSTEAKEEQDKLDALVAANAGVRAITKEEHDRYLQKKTRGLQSWNILTAPSPRENSAIKGSGNVVVVEGKPESPEGSVAAEPVVEVANEALVLGSVSGETAPETAPEPAKPQEPELVATETKPATTEETARRRSRGGSRTQG